VVLAISYKEDSLDSIDSYIEIASNNKIDFIEICLDEINNIDLQAITNKLSPVELNLILSFKSNWFGGKSNLEDEKRFGIIQKLLVLQPNFVKLDYPIDMPHLSSLPESITPIICFYDNEGIIKIDLESIITLLESKKNLLLDICIKPNTLSNLFQVQKWTDELYNQFPNRVSINVIGKFEIFCRNRFDIFHSRFVYLTKIVLDNDFLHLDQSQINILFVGSETIYLHATKLMKKYFTDFSPKINFEFLPIDYDSDINLLLKWLKKENFNALHLSGSFQGNSLILINDFDSTVLKTGLVDLVVQTNSKTKAYNTSVLAFENILHQAFNNESPTVYLEGVNEILIAFIGGVGNLVEAMVMRNRTEEKIDRLQQKYHNLINSKNSDVDVYDLVINAVPFGEGELPNISPVPTSILKSCSLAIDLSLLQHTPPLISDAMKFNIPVISGSNFLLLRIVKTIELILKKSIPTNLFFKSE
jgi:shikimate 5-dehydrogenase/3-dehydroquinate dehydratase